MISRIAIVGRPNVGKSTLLNRLAKRRISIVHDKPGVTRDRVTVEVEIKDRIVEVIDTGGLGVTDEAQLDLDIHRQIDIAIASADLVLMIVDAKEGIQALDHEVAKRLRPLDAPTLLVVMRFCQGLGLGGEWSGAALLATENAPAGKRDRTSAPSSLSRA